MARSTYVWVVQGTSNQILGVYTVKHELIRDYFACAYNVGTTICRVAGNNKEYLDVTKQIAEEASA